MSGPPRTRGRGAPTASRWRPVARREQVPSTARRASSSLHHAVFLAEHAGRFVEDRSRAPTGDEGRSRARARDHLDLHLTPRGMAERHGVGSRLAHHERTERWPRRDRSRDVIEHDAPRSTVSESTETRAVSPGRSRERSHVSAARTARAAASRLFPVRMPDRMNSSAGRDAERRDVAIARPTSGSVASSPRGRPSAIP